jgi:hypothetical protein
MTPKRGLSIISLLEEKSLLIPRGNNALDGREE